MQNAQREHSAILSTFIKLPSVIKMFVVSIFEWPLRTGFTVTTCIPVTLAQNFMISHSLNVYEKFFTAYENIIKHNFLKDYNRLKDFFPFAQYFLFFVYIIIPPPPLIKPREVGVFHK